MTYLSKGDVALSVCMTSVSTILAPFMTPLLTLLYAGKTVDVQVVGMFISVIKVVLVPIILGIVVNRFFSKVTEKAVKALPLISTTAIVLIIAAVVSVNSARIMQNGLLIVCVVICHNVLPCSKGLEAGHHKVSCHFHRSGYAELGTRDKPCSNALCPVSACNGSGSSLLRMAQHFRSDSCEHFQLQLEARRKDLSGRVYLL